MMPIIFGLVGGLGLFIFGMKYLTEGLQRVAGTRMRRILRSLTDNRFKGIALGALVTSIIQSSSVTTVMIIGLINAGIVSLMQSASVVIGANIGTTITAQIIAFKISKYALPAIGIGVAMMFARKKNVNFWGQVLISFGLIFLGLSTMSGVMKPLKDYPSVINFFVSLSHNPFLCILLGVGFTFVVQSSSASIGMVLAMASTGLIDFTTGIYFILGDNIGTTITAWLASIGGSLSAKRMACFHSFFNIIGVIYMTILVKTGIYPAFIDYITPGAVNEETIARHLANAHTFFNVFNAIVFVFLIGPVVALIKKILPGEDMYVSSDFKFLQDKLLSTPDIAIDSTKKELEAMAKMVQKVVKTALEGFFKGDKQSIPHVETQESAIDHLQKDMTFYVAKLSGHNLSTDLAEKVPRLLHSINDLERVADLSVNISELTNAVYSDEIKFSNNAQAEMRTMYAKLDEMFDAMLRVISSDDKMAFERIAFYEKELNSMQVEYRDKHMKRLCHQKCDPQSGLVFMEYINNVERMGDHLFNVALAARNDFLGSDRD